MKKNSIALAVTILGFLAISSKIGFADEAKLVTIIPSQNTDMTRMKQLTVGDTYYTNTGNKYPDSAVPADGVLIEGQVAIGHGSVQSDITSNWVARDTGTDVNYGLLSVNNCQIAETRGDDDVDDTKAAYRKRFILMINDADADYWQFAIARNDTVPEYTSALQIRQRFWNYKSVPQRDDTLTELTILNSNGYGNGTGGGWVGAGTERPQGILDLNSKKDDSFNLGGLIVPRMTAGDRDTNIPPAKAVNGMIIYNTTTKKFNVRESDAWREFS